MILKKWGSKSEDSSKFDKFMSNIQFAKSTSADEDFSFDPKKHTIVEDFAIQKPKKKILKKAISLKTIKVELDQLENGGETYFFNEYISNLRYQIYRMKLYRFLNKKRFEKQYRRLNQVNEVLSTEKTYLDLLSFLVDKVEAPLKKADILKPDQIKLIFSNIKSIRGISESLYRDLVKDYKNFPSFKVSRSFVAIASFFKMYKVYINNYDKGADKLTKLMKKNMKFQKYLNEVLRSPDNKGQLGITDLTILPVQRIPRYRMLLEGIIKYTNPKNIEYNDLKSALKTVEECASFVNASRLEDSHKEIFVKLSKMIKGKDLFDQPFRKFQKQIKCQMMCFQKNMMEFKNYEAYLFNDLCVLVEFTESKLDLFKNIQTHVVDFMTGKIEKVISPFDESEVLSLDDGKGNCYLLILERGIKEEFFKETKKFVDDCKSSLLRKNS